MLKAVDIATALEGLPELSGRTPETPGDQVAAAFATLATTREGGVFAGSFSGDSAWERHNNGDELVQVLAGAAELTVVTDDGPQILALRVGMLSVVPQGCWHRFRAPDGVTVLTMTPQPTDHATGETPPLER